MYAYVQIPPYGACCLEIYWTPHLVPRDFSLAWGRTPKPADDPRAFSRPAPNQGKGPGSEVGLIELHPVEARYEWFVRWTPDRAVRVRVLIKALNSRSASFHTGIYMNTCELNAREGNPAIEKRPVRGEGRVKTL